MIYSLIDCRLIHWAIGGGGPGDTSNLIDVAFIDNLINLAFVYGGSDEILIHWLILNVAVSGDMLICCCCNCKICMGVTPGCCLLI